MYRAGDKILALKEVVVDREATPYLRQLDLYIYIYRSRSNYNYIIYNYNLCCNSTIQYASAAHWLILHYREQEIYFNIIFLSILLFNVRFIIYFLAQDLLKLRELKIAINV